MLSRISQVQNINITSLSNSSITQIGDSKYVNALSRALAVQREAEIFFSYEGDFSQYPIFSESIPLPPLEEEFHFQKVDLAPCIKVSHIKINGIASASIVHIGNTECVYMESRVKHIRHLLDED
jgi:spore germination protein PE